MISATAQPTPVKIKKNSSPRVIVHCARRFSPSRGGVETHLAALVKLHQAQGDQLVIITEQTELDWPKNEQFSQGKIIRLVGPFSKLKVWQQIWQLRGLLQAATLVHAHDVGWWLLPVWPFIAQKFFITFHGWEGQWPVRWQAKLHRWLLSKLAVGTIHVGAWIQAWYWDTPSRITYGGVWFNQIQNPSVRQLKQALAKRSLSIVFVGRLETENEISQYVASIKYLRENGWKLNVRWVGDGSLRAQAALVGKVLGMVDAATLTQQIQTADLVFANSYLSIWDALAAGKLVAAVASTPLKEKYLASFPAAQHLLQFTKVTELEKKLVDLQQRSQFELTTQLMAQQQTVQRHSWQAVFEDYEAVWRMKK